MNKQQSPECENFINIQTYHSLLWDELMMLFCFLRGICNKHQTEAEYSFSRAILFTIFGAIETASRVLASSALLAHACIEQEIPYEINEGPKPVSLLTNAEKLFLCQNILFGV